VADPVTKPANPAGATAGKSGPASPAASAPSTPAPAPNGAKPQPAGAPASKPAAQAAAKPIASVDDLIERAEDRLIPKGSTVRLSPDNPDLTSKARQEELEDSLEACGIKVVWDKSMGKTDIVVDAAKPKGK
jgi:hypothetical protein